MPQDIWAGVVFWVAIHGGLAVLLFAATVATFDRSLGRVPESSSVARSGSWKKWRPLLDLEFDDEIAPEPPDRPIDPPMGWVDARGSPQPQG